MIRSAVSLLRRILWLMTFLLALAACDPGPEADAVPPLIWNVHSAASPSNVLSAAVWFDTDEPAITSLALRSGDGHEITLSSGSVPSTGHRFSVWGLHAETLYRITVSATDSAENTARKELDAYRTPPLPRDIPPLQTLVSDPSRMQLGVTLFSVTRWTPARDNNWGLLLAVDESGEVVWYHRTRAPVTDVRRLWGGNLRYLVGAHGAAEIDMLGNLVAVFQANELEPPVDSFHDEILQLPSGNFLTLSTELRSLAGYQETSGSTSFDVVSDVLVEFTSGRQVVNRWSLFDVLDPLRVRLGFHLPYYNTMYKDKSQNPKDWSHANSIYFDPADDSVLLSLMHQDWVIKTDRGTGEMRWRFGPEGDFELQGAGEWPYHQNAARLLPNGNLILFDSGTGRPGAQHFSEWTSRVVEYRLDTDNMTATQVWEFRGREPFYSEYNGEADLLPDGNVLITDGGRGKDPMLSYLHPENLKFARILEVTHTDAPEVVFELLVRDEEGGVGYSVHSSERLLRQYP